MRTKGYIIIIVVVSVCNIHNVRCYRARIERQTLKKRLGAFLFIVNL